jgi:hypothetical protein
LEIGHKKERLFQLLDMATHLIVKKVKDRGDATTTLKILLAIMIIQRLVNKVIVKG